MHARKAMLAMILLIMPLLLTGVLTNLPQGDVSSDVVSEPTKVSLISYVERGPLVVNNDSHFLALDGTYLWDGDGTEGSPIIIEGYNITADSDCLTIEDVSLYFEIRDCYFDSISVTPPTTYGIFFQNVTHGLVVDTFVVNKNMGIHFSESPYNTIQNTSILDCSATGVNIYLSNNTLVDESTIGDCGNGLDVISSNFTDVMRSEIYGGMGGISVGQSSNCTFEANSIHNNRVGIQRDGIHFFEVDNSSIVANEIFENQQNGIYTVYGEDNYIFDNHIFNNSDHGIDIMDSDNITISQNNIHGNGWWPVLVNELCGIYLGSSTVDIHVEGNQIWNNTPSGISLEGSYFTNVTGNDIFNNTAQGIFGFMAGDITIIDNQISGNGWNPGVTPFTACGVYNYGAGNWSIESNNIWNNTKHGIYTSSQDVSVIENRVWDSNNTGILVEEIYNYTVAENIVFDNERGIELVAIRINVTSNIVYDNDVGIYADYTGDCFIYDNDIGWNSMNAFQKWDIGNTYWHDNDSLGNWWHDYSGSGNYSILNETGGYIYDIYPHKNMWLNSATSIEYEISSTGNTLEFDAFALNPQSYRVYENNTLFENNDNWDGGPISLNVDGLSAGVHEFWFIIYHVSWHALSVYSYANVTDLTAPEWITPPSDQVIDEGEALSAQFEASDVSGIGTWWTNDTENFYIDETGLLTNNTVLPIGDYGLRVYVNDTYGNIAMWDIRIQVLYVEPTSTTTPTTPEPPPPFDGTGLLVIVAGAGGAIVILVIIVVVVRNKEKIPRSAFD